MKEETSDTGSGQQVQKQRKLSLLEVETSESDDNDNVTGTVCDEVLRYEAEPQISVTADALLWWKEHSASLRCHKWQRSTSAHQLPWSRGVHGDGILVPSPPVPELNLIRPRPSP